MPNTLTRVATRLFGVPLLLEETYAHVVTSALADRLNVEPLVEQGVMDRYVRPNTRMAMHRQSGIAVIPVVGGMVHRGDGPEAQSGLQSYTSLQNKISEVIDDRSVRGILLDIDSGGGEAAGIHELSDFIVKARQQKPIWAIANTAACSGGYWLACASERVYATQGSRVGSIGVYVSHVDVSRQTANRGIVVSFIYAGKHKVDGHPFAALSADVRRSIQAGVDVLYGEFVNYVAERRSLTKEEVRKTEAGVFGPDAAKEIGLIDGIGGLGDVLAAMAEVITRPAVAGFKIIGDSMSNTALYTADDLNRAKADAGTAARAEAEQAAQGRIDSAVSTAKAEGRKEVAVAVSELMPESKRIKTFCEAVNDGASVSLASKFAGQIEDAAPKAEVKNETPLTATDKSVDRIMAAHSPKTEADAGKDGGDKRAARMAEITATTKSYNAARGYVAAR